MSLNINEWRENLINEKINEGYKKVNVRGVFNDDTSDDQKFAGRAYQLDDGSVEILSCPYYGSPDEDSRYTFDHNVLMGQKIYYYLPAPRFVFSKINLEGPIIEFRKHDCHYSNIAFGKYIKDNGYSVRDGIWVDSWELENFSPDLRRSTKYRITSNVVYSKGIPQTREDYITGPQEHEKSQKINSITYKDCYIDKVTVFDNKVFNAKFNFDYIVYKFNRGTVESPVIVMFNEKISKLYFLDDDMSKDGYMVEYEPRIQAFDISYYSEDVVIGPLLFRELWNGEKSIIPTITGGHNQIPIIKNIIFDYLGKTPYDDQIIKIKDILMKSHIPSEVSKTIDYLNKT